jgi:hypothetical protein
MFYIKYFHHATKFRTFLFADDTSALQAGKDLTQLFFDINTELKKPSDLSEQTKWPLIQQRPNKLYFASEAK